MWSKKLKVSCYALLLISDIVVNSFIIHHRHQVGITIGRSNSHHDTVVKKTGLFANNNDDGNENKQRDAARREFVYNGIGAVLLGASGLSTYSLYKYNFYTPPGIQRLPRTQFIAALGDPKASEGPIVSKDSWGLWNVDPGPRGVFLRDYEKDILQKDKMIAPAGWTFDPNNWWLEEHGLIMESPDFPLQDGKYLVTGGRTVTTILTILDNKWKLDEGTLYDITHLPCRSAKYQPNGDGGSPVSANPKDFPVTPGAVMPSVPGAKQQDYAVLFVLGKTV